MPNKLYILNNISSHAVPVVNQWIKEKNFIRPAILIQAHSDVKREDFNYKTYNQLDLMPTNSDEEENTYKEVFIENEKYKKTLNLKFYGVNLFPDIASYFGISYEYITILFKCINNLLEMNHDVVIVCFHYTAFYYTSLLEEAKTCKLVDQDAVSLRYDNESRLVAETSHAAFSSKNWFKLFIFFRKYIRAVLDAVPEKTKGKDNDEFEISKGYPLLYVSTSEMLYNNNFKPIYRALSRKLNNPPCLTNCKELINNIFEKDVPFVSLSSIKYFDLFFLKECFFFIFRLYKVIKKITHKNFRPVRKFGSEVHLAILLNLLSNENFFHNKMIELMKDVARINLYIRKYKPTCIYKQVRLTSLDWTFSEFGKKYNIPIISSIHASISERYRDFVSSPDTYITVIGTEQISILLRRGYQQEQIVLGGQPELDDVSEKWTKYNSIQYIQNNFSTFSENKKTFLVVTSCFDRKNEIKWVRQLIELIGKSGDSQIIIKPHPASGSYYNEISTGDNIFIARFDMPIYPFLTVCDWAFTDVSHAGKLAIYFRKKLVIVNYSGKEFPYNQFDEEGLAISIRSSNEMNCFVEQCSTIDMDASNSYPGFIKRNFTANDGKASERIADFILSYPHPL